MGLEPKDNNQEQGDREVDLTDNNEEKLDDQEQSGGEVNQYANNDKNLNNKEQSGGEVDLTNNNEEKLDDQEQSGGEVNQYANNEKKLNNQEQSGGELDQKDNNEEKLDDQEQSGGEVNQYANNEKNLNNKEQSGGEVDQKDNNKEKLDDQKQSGGEVNQYVNNEENLNNKEQSGGEVDQKDNNEEKLDDQEKGGREVDKHANNEKKLDNQEKSAGEGDREDNNGEKLIEEDGESNKRRKLDEDYQIRLIEKESNENVQVYEILHDEKCLKYKQVLDLLTDESETFRNTFTEKLNSCGFTGYRWEVVPTRQDLINDMEFKFAIVESNILDKMQPNRQPFSKFFRESQNKHVTSFYNLGKDAMLVCPLPEQNPESTEFSHIGKFLREAHDIAQIHSFWIEVSNVMQEQLKEKPKCALWLSTAGSGVAWLHVRIDTFPKYYLHKSFTKPPTEAKKSFSWFQPNTWF